MISELNRQQRILLNAKIRSIPDRIVNLVQRHARPIVRGKAKAAVEFGAKISVSMCNGFAFLHRISWDAYNESEDLIEQAKKYKHEYGCFPERICADRIYINTKNRHFCASHNIRLSGKRLGRPPKDQDVNAAHQQQLRADQRRRSEVEGCFGSGKRKYSLGLLMARLSKGADTTISMAFMVMCAEKFLRLLYFFPYFHLVGPRSLAMLTPMGSRELYSSWVGLIADLCIIRIAGGMALFVGRTRGAIWFSEALSQSLGFPRQSPWNSLTDNDL